MWVFGWFVASVDWAVGFNRIRGLMNDVLSNWCSGSHNLQSDTFVQASIAVVSTVDCVCCAWQCNDFHACHLNRH